MFLRDGFNLATFCIYEVRRGKFLRYDRVMGVLNEESRIKTKTEQ